VAQGVIYKDKGGHSLDDGHSARQDAGIMSAAGFQCGVLELGVHGILLAHNRGDRLEGDPEVNGLAVGDAPLDAAGTVRGRAYLAVFGSERVVVLRAGKNDAAEAGADIESL